MRTEEIPNANAFHLDEEPPVVKVPEFQTVRTQTIEERRGQPLLIWAILGVAGIVFGALFAFLWQQSNRIQATSDRMQTAIEHQGKSVDTALAVARDAVTIAQAAQVDKAAIEGRMDHIMDDHHKIAISMGQLGAKFGQLEKRVAAVSAQPATITGTINAPAAIQKPIPPALGRHPGESAIAPAMDELGLERVYRSNAAEDSWRVLTSDNRRIEVRPLGSSSDGTIYVKDVASGATYFIDGKTRVAYASRK